MSGTFRCRLAPSHVLPRSNSMVEYTLNVTKKFAADAPSDWRASDSLTSRSSWHLVRFYIVAAKNDKRNRAKALQRPLFNERMTRLRFICKTMQAVRECARISYTVKKSVRAFLDPWLREIQIVFASRYASGGDFCEWRRCAWVRVKCPSVRMKRCPSVHVMVCPSVHITCT